jgi:hypothetical protein
MFEVGKYYRFSMLDAKDKVVEMAACKIVEVALPLVKIRQMAVGEMVINTASLVFVSARAVDEDSAD